MDKKIDMIEMRGVINNLVALKDQRNGNAALKDIIENVRPYDRVLSEKLSKVEVSIAELDQYITEKTKG